MANHNMFRGSAAMLIVFALIFAEACSKPSKKESEPGVPVQASTAKLDSIHNIIRAQATLYPSDQAAITSKISAPVRRFYVSRGDHVRKGQLLAELENRDLAAAAAEAKGNYDQATANYRNLTAATLPEEVVKSQGDVQSNKEALDAAQKVYESRKKLFEEGAIPRKQVDEAQVAYVQARNQYEVSLTHLESLQKTGKASQIEAAQAQMDAAKGRHEAAEAQLQYSRITSPIDGVIADRPLYVGEMAGTGTMLLTVMDISTIVARASIPVEELGSLKVGDEATIMIEDISETVHGKVTVISPALDPNSTTAEVWVEGHNPDERLHPGSTVRIAITAETIPEALVIPSSAILPSQQGAADTVLVVGSDSLAHERKIETGVHEDNRVQVIKGLSPGEQVITAGGFGLRDGTKVQLEYAGKKE